MQYAEPVLTPELAIGYSRQLSSGYAVVLELRRRTTRWLHVECTTPARDSPPYKDSEV